MTPAKGSPANPNGSPRMPGCMSLILELGDEARVKTKKKKETFTAPACVQFHDVT